jgi:hypothetical protein
LRTARVNKRRGFRVDLGGRGFVTLGGRDFIVTLGVGGFSVTLGVGLGGFIVTLRRGLIITLTSGDDHDEVEEDDEDEGELESFRSNSKKTAVHCSIKQMQCKQFDVVYEESLIFDKEKS